MRTHLILFFVLLLVSCLGAQTIPGAAQVISKINQEVASCQQGYFDQTFHWKSMSKKDTSIGSTRTYFFKQKNLPDSNAQAIIVADGRLWQAYDGERYYTAHHSVKKIVIRNAVGIAPKKKDLWNRKTFIPFLNPSSKTAFNEEGFTKSIISIDDSKTNSTLVFTELDSFPNDLKSRPEDPAMMQYKLTHRFDLLTGRLLSVQEEVNTFVLPPQYLEHFLQPINPLPDSITFERVLAKYSKGYTFEQDIESAPKAAQPELKIKDTLSGLSLKTLDNKEVEFMPKHHKLVLFDFWYIGCAPCMMAMPEVERIYAQFREKGLAVYGVNVADKAEDIQQFIERHRIPYEMLMDCNKEFAKRNNVVGYPTLVLFDPDSKKVIYHITGFSKSEGYTELEVLLKGILQ
jgi:thiol-disulfide isomerase/thioredoxin